MKIRFVTGFVHTRNGSIVQEQSLFNEHQKVQIQYHFNYVYLSFLVLCCASSLCTLSAAVW